MATRVKAKLEFKDFLTQRLSMSDAIPVNFLPGILTDSFVLSVEYPGIKGKGNIFAWKPLMWDGLMNIADFDDNDDSSLYLNINNVKGNAVRLSLSVCAFTYPRKAGNGKLSVDFDNGSSSKHSRLISFPFDSYTLTSYAVQSKKITNDSTTVKIWSKEFTHWALREVKVEIFVPYY